MRISKEEIIARDSELLAKRAMQIHRGAARAAVLGVNDGLVSTLCITLAVAAAAGTAHAVLIAGFAGLIAGAISMAAGEWISVTSQVELFKGVLTDLKKMVKEDKEMLTGQLKENFVSNGLNVKTAASASTEIAIEDERLTLEYARRVMGINPDELGSPWIAAFSSFLLFTLGSMVALFPWLFTEGVLAIGLSISFTMVGGLVVGGFVSRTGGGNVLKGGIRQLLIIAFASIVTYGIGHLFGVAIG